MAHWCFHKYIQKKAIFALLISLISKVFGRLLFLLKIFEKFLNKEEKGRLQQTILTENPNPEHSGPQIKSKIPVVSHR